jgi:polysaccharide biosynthesis/export protein
MLAQVFADTRFVCVLVSFATMSFRLIKTASILGACLAVAGCNFLPSSGPYGVQYKTDAESQSTEALPYELIKVTPEILSHIASRNAPSLSGTFTDRRPAREIRLGVGDTVNITIFEAAAGGLFIPEQAGTRPGNFVALPPQAVDKSGNLTVPYAGVIRAAGRSIPDVQADIVQRLRNRAIEPQVVLSVQEQRSAQVSVLGDVNVAVRFAANPAGDKVLDAIARAGGPRSQGYETFVTLQRGKKQATVGFNSLVKNPQNNIYVQPGDIIYVYREASAFIALGASGESGRFNFDAENITLTDAIGRAGGLLDERADPSQVYLYRLENRKSVENMGIDLTRWENAKYIPVIYMVNLREPSGFFTAGKIAMRDRDVVFVGNAPAVDLVKALQVIRIGVATVREADASRELGN